MQKETQLRIISALAMFILFTVLLFLGPNYLVALSAIIGLIVHDEIMVNFLKKHRRSKSYSVSLLSLVFGLLFVVFWSDKDLIAKVFGNLAFVINLVLLLYLFSWRGPFLNLVKMLSKYPFFVGIILLPSLSTLIILLEFHHWTYLLLLLLIINFGMDVGAWFFGRKFGHRKLWIRVSPKKTVEGLLGGMFFSAILATSFSYFYGRPISFQLFLIFLLLSVLSQAGDLIQSKLKRFFEIKDSSSMIPGHGGVYDRFDSLLFLSPFFLVFVHYFYF